MRASMMICQVQDMDRAVAFYRDVLGFKAGNLSPYWSDFNAGGVEIGLHPLFSGAENTTPSSRPGWILGLEVDDLKALRATLQAAGTRITGDYHDIPGGVTFDFVDPDGNPIEVVQHGITTADLQA